MSIIDNAIATVTGRKARTTTDTAAAPPAAPVVPSHADRVAQLEQARASVADATERKVKELQRQIAQEREDRDRELARLEAAAAEVRREVAAGLTARWLDAAAPLVRAWTEEPSRLTGRALAAGLLELRADVGVGLGIELDPWIVVVPFAELVIATKPGAIDTIVDLNASLATSPIVLAYRAIQSLDAIPTFVDRIADLESALQHIGATSSGSPRPENVARWRVIRANVIDRQARTLALEVLNVGIESERLAALPAASGNGRII